ncbi:hypothetical protein CW304_08745 [Bacillus sp. UFRGS-B20]|nr:hypothetical protein CW304_08745 [Bacillus sp. UFRGS-B20]
MKKFKITKEQIENTPETLLYIQVLVHLTWKKSRIYYDRKLVKLFDRDDVAIYNSIRNGKKRYINDE